MEEVLSVYQINDILIIGFIIGMIFNMIQDIIMSLINYLNNKAWRVNDYERILYLIDQENSLSWTRKDFINMSQAIDNYKNKLERKSRLQKILNKFRRNKKDV